jgi:UDP-glucose 4-epimerase
MRAKKISLVTGGAGFIGSHLVDLLLSKGHQVRVLDDLSGGHYENIKHNLKNKNFIFKKKNILFLKKNENIFKDVQYVFHLAGKGDIVPSIENPVDYMDTNVMGTVKVLENCKKLNLIKFIYAASSSCYGLAKTPTKENHPISPLYPYALSKYMGEQACFHWAKVYKIPINSIRIFNAYGTRVKTTGVYGAVFGVFLKQKLKNKPLTIVGNGSQRRDFLYVTDVANAFYLLSKSKYTNNIYNVGADKPVKIMNLAKLLSNKFQFIPRRPSEPDCTWANISKIKNHTGWKPKISFIIGVKKMLENIKDWSNAPLWDVKSINKATKTWFKYLS